MNTTQTETVITLAATCQGVGHAKVVSDNLPAGHTKEVSDNLPVGHAKEVSDNLPVGQRPCPRSRPNALPKEVSDNFPVGHVKEVSDNFPVGHAKEAINHTKEVSDNLAIGHGRGVSDNLTIGHKPHKRAMSLQYHSNIVGKKYEIVYLPQRKINKISDEGNLDS
ncbi:hypothetical protein RRG08_009328 [Elysia crispata]|uniref:Uncharacterized protein n=1 Tax=Elysia crispata TaxID=231223 RepID=A0AAE1DKS8_9GAST|nr:hypothetical protein RRG08_009328 [Elysia crispata]